MRDIDVNGLARIGTASLLTRLALMASGFTTAVRWLRTSAWCAGAIAATSALPATSAAEELPKVRTALVVSNTVPQRLVIREPRPGQSTTADLNAAQQIPGQPTSQASGDVASRISSIHAAALRERESRIEPRWQVLDERKPVLAGYSADSLRHSAKTSIDEASVKLASRAYLSAEAKAIEALRWIAQGVDANVPVQNRHLAGLASRDLAVALTALREAEDFAGKYGAVDGAAVTRMVRSHTTEFLKPYDTQTLSGLAAADVYLDGSRQYLQGLAEADPMAAEAIRILAQSYRLRDEGTPFGLATSVHLMRAAAGGAPEDPRIAIQLAQTLKAAGLHDESRWAQAQVDRLAAAPQPGRGMLVSDEVSPTDDFDAQFAWDQPASSQHGGEVQLMQVSPEQFAAISARAAGPPGVPSALGAAAQPSAPQNRSLAVHGGERDELANGGAPSEPAGSASSGSGHRFSRALDPIRRLWQ